MKTTLANSNMGRPPLYTLQENALATRRIILHPLEQQDMALLHKWRNDPMFMNLCSVRRNTINFAEFVAELRHDFDRDRHIQYIIELKGKERKIGTIYSYSLNLIDGLCFVTTYLSEDYQNKGYGVEAVAVFLKHLFDSFSLNKIYMETYDYNRLSISPLRKFGFQEEGCFKEHRFLNGRRWDLIRFAIYRNSLDKINNYVAHFKINKKGGDNNGKLKK